MGLSMLQPYSRHVNRAGRGYNIIAIQVRQPRSRRVATVTTSKEDDTFLQKYNVYRMMEQSMHSSVFGENYQPVPARKSYCKFLQSFLSRYREHITPTTYLHDHVFYPDQRIPYFIVVIKLTIMKYANRLADYFCTITEMHDKNMYLPEGPAREGIRKVTRFVDENDFLEGLKLIGKHYLLKGTLQNFSPEICQKRLC